MARNEPILVMNDEEETSCAWCLTENGEELGNGSHGICVPHAQQVELNYQVSRFSRVKSYVERFRDGRESFS